ncbi:Xaa-Pro dipeptidyl-peptidase, partial [Plantactinospora endophytica]
EPPAATEPHATEPTAATGPPAASPPPGSECAEHKALKTATLGAGRRQVQPAGRYFRAGHGRQSGCLDGPAGANFDLILQKWSRGGWRTVAVSNGPTADEQISYSGSAGFYRYRVESRRGAGDYTLGFSVR